MSNFRKDLAEQGAVEGAVAAQMLTGQEAEVKAGWDRYDRGEQQEQNGNKERPADPQYGPAQNEPQQDSPARQLLRELDSQQQGSDSQSPARDLLEQLGTQKGEQSAGQTQEKLADKQQAPERYQENLPELER